MLKKEEEATIQELQVLCKERLERLYQKNGYLPSSHQLLFTRDPALNWKRRWRLYATTPHLRWELVASYFIHSIRGVRKIRGGRSQVLDNGSRFSGDASTFYFNGLILELLESFREGGGTPEWETRWEREILAEFESDVLEYPQAGGMVPAWGYFPVRHHRFRPGNRVYRLMHRWGAISADLDSSSMVLARLVKAGSKRVGIGEILTLLEEHVRGRGKHGTAPLAYDNGVEEDDQGVLLWVHEKHNELDAGVNVNILCLLSILHGRGDGADRARVERLSASIFRFLDRHIALGSFSRKAFLMFYSLEAFSFLWHRLAVALDDMPPESRERFDPMDVCGKLGGTLAALLEPEVRDGAIPFNSFDRLLALPVLIRYRSRASAPWLTAPALRAMVEDVSSRAYEFGKFVYPVTFLYGNAALGLCAALNVFRELERPGASPMDGQGNPCPP
jgi:hypothetical protein